MPLSTGLAMLAGAVVLLAAAFLIVYVGVRLTRRGEDE